MLHEKDIKSFEAQIKSDCETSTATKTIININEYFSVFISNATD